MTASLPCDQFVRVCQKTATCLQEDGGWLTVYKFRKHVHGVGVIERLRHFAMWKTEQGGCRYKVYET